MIRASPTASLAPSARRHVEGVRTSVFEVEGLGLLVGDSERAGAFKVLT